MTYHHLCNIENPRLHFFRAPHWLRRGGRMQTSGITDLIEASPCNEASKKALACELPRANVRSAPPRRPGTRSLTRIQP